MKAKTFPVENKDIIALFLSFVSMFIVSRIGVLGALNMGFSIGCALALGVSFIYVRKKEAKSKIFSIVLLLLCFALIASFSLTGDNVIKFCTIVYLPFVTTFLLCNVSNNIDLKKGTYKSFLNSALKTSEGALIKLDVTFRSYVERLTRNKSKNAIYVIIGIIIAVPLLCIVLPLLSSSDIAFASMVSAIFKNAGILLVALVLTVVIFPSVYSYLFSMRKQSVSDKPSKLSTGKLSNIVFNIVLSTVSVVYCAYAISQLAYITKAFAFLLPEDFTAAQFARSGFFQMGVISFINFLLLAITAMFVKRNNKKIPASTKALLGFVCLFTDFYIATAIIKMLKYISLYGLTHLRVLTSVFMLMLALIFVVLLLRLFTPKIKYAKAVVIICTLALLSVSVIDVKTVIAEYNFNQHQKGNIAIDVEQIGSLGVSGIPTLVKLTEDENQAIADEATMELMCVCYDVYDNAFVRLSADEKLIPVKTKFYEKNISWIKAKEALDEFLKKNPNLYMQEFDEYYYRTYSVDE